MKKQTKTNKSSDGQIFQQIDERDQKFIELFGEDSVVLKLRRNYQRLKDEGKLDE